MARRRTIRIIDPGVLVLIIKKVPFSDVDVTSDLNMGLILRSYGPYGDDGFDVMYYDVLTPFGMYQFSDVSLEPL